MDLKKCSRCARTLPISEFHRHKTRKYQTYCKDCKRAIDQKTYEARGQYIRDRNRAGRVRRTAVAREFISKYLDTHPCVDCGQDCKKILTFDHVSGTKEFNISDAVCQGMTLCRIEAEIGKCQVRCFNCHMSKTCQQQNWYKEDN